MWFCTAWEEEVAKITLLIEVQKWNLCQHQLSTILKFQGHYIGIVFKRRKEQRKEKGARHLSIYFVQMLY